MNLRRILQRLPRVCRNFCLSLRVQLSYNPSPIVYSFLLLLLVPLFLFISSYVVTYHEYEEHIETSSHHHDDHLFAQHSHAPFPWFNPYLDDSERIRQLMGSLLLSEKITLLSYDFPATHRVGLAAHSWALPLTDLSNLHVVFPQPIALGATFDVNNVERVGKSIHDSVLRKSNAKDAPLSRGVLAPNVDVFVDPLWGRGQWTFGEDPYLVSRLAVATVKGIQGTKEHERIAATCMAFVTPSDDHIDVSPSDFHQTFLPSLRACLVEGGALMFMCSGRSVNGHPGCMSPTIRKIVRNSWRFDGVMISDANAIESAVLKLRKSQDIDVAVQEAIQSTVDVDWSHAYERYLPVLASKNSKLLANIDDSTNRVLRMLLEVDSLNSKPVSVPRLNVAEQQKLALEVAIDSLVLLKNSGALLPLCFQHPRSRWNPDEWDVPPPTEPESTLVSKVAIVGPSMQDYGSMIGSSFSCDAKIGPKYVTPLEAISSYVLSFENTEVRSTMGATNHTHITSTQLDEAVGIVASADVAILIVGLTTCCGDDRHDGCGNINRKSINLPESQRKLVRQLSKVTSTPLVLVVLAGVPVDISEFVPSVKISSIIYGFYPGSETGHALAKVIFGRAVPSGRLPVSLPLSDEQLVISEKGKRGKQLSMTAGKGRTYRYSKEVPLFTFGYGMSYTHFQHHVVVENKRVTYATPLVVTVTVKNVGLWPGADVVQLYTTPKESVTFYELKAFKRVYLFPGVEETVTLKVEHTDLRLFVKDRLKIVSGNYQLYITNQGRPGAIGEYVQSEQRANVFQAGYTLIG